MQFITGYLVEKSLSIDNIFVFLMLFSYFAVPPQYQKRALIVGIIGAIILRTLLILVGAWLLATFHWLLYVFGAFLVLTGAKMWFAAGQEPDISTNPVLGLLTSASASPTALMANSSPPWSMASSTTRRCLWCWC